MNIQLETSIGYPQTNVAHLHSLLELLQVGTDNLFLIGRYFSS